MDDLRDLLSRTTSHIADYREGLAASPVTRDVDLGKLRTALGGPLPDAPQPAGEVIDRLVAGAEVAVVASAGPRYFGFVTGGSLDAALCADLLTAGWDQNGGLGVLSPAAAVVEEVAGAWLVDLLGLPAGTSVGFTTGGQGANLIGLAAARHHVLARAGWDVEADGLIGAPPVRIVVGAERHITIDRGLRFLGLGTRLIEEVPTGGNGAIDVEALDDVLGAGTDGPTVVCLQAGNVNTGAFDDLKAAATVARRHGAWVHVDGAFGLWAAASPEHRHLVDGLELADSWATDGHKWLNVPYDSGFAFCAHPEVHVAAMSASASYLQTAGEDELRTPYDHVTEASRRARGFATWAALQELGRSGVADLVDRCCRLARRFAEGLDGRNGIQVLNEVVLNQVLVRLDGDDERTDRLVAAVQRDGTCWMGGATWHGMRVMRISVSNWSTTDADVDRSVAAVLAAAA